MYQHVTKTFYQYDLLISCTFSSIIHFILKTVHFWFPFPSNPSCVYVVNATTAYLQVDIDFERAELKGKDKRTYKSQTFLLNKTAKYIYIVTLWCIRAFTSWFIHLLDTDVILF